METAICPECDEDVAVSEEIELGELVICPECDSELELLETDPLELGTYFDEEMTDFDDEDDNYSDYEEDEDDEFSEYDDDDDDEIFDIFDDDAEV